MKKWVESFCQSDIGIKRKNNEDSVGCYEPVESGQLQDSGCLYVVADGLGGHEYGERASRLAVDTLLTHYYDAPHISPDKRIRDLIQQVNQGLIAFSKKNLAAGEKTATTVVVAVVRAAPEVVVHMPTQVSLELLSQLEPIPATVTLY